MPKVEQIIKPQIIKPKVHTMEKKHVTSVYDTISAYTQKPPKAILPSKVVRTGFEGKKMKTKKISVNQMEIGKWRFKDELGPSTKKSEEGSIVGSRKQTR